MVLDWGMAKVWSKNPSPVEAGKSLASKLRKDSKSDANITLMTPLHGTPAYLSPEQLLNHNLVDHRSDIYCLGAILYEILVMKRMSIGETVGEVVEFIENGEFEPPIPVVIDSSSTEELVDVCMRCVARDVDDRYQSLERMIHDLEHWMLLRPLETEDSELASG